MLHTSVEYLTNLPLCELREITKEAIEIGREQKRVQNGHKDSWRN